jgi:hypothetical protein
MVRSSQAPPIVGGSAAGVEREEERSLAVKTKNAAPACLSHAVVYPEPGDESTGSASGVKRLREARCIALEGRWITGRTIPRANIQ